MYSVARGGGEGEVEMVEEVEKKSDSDVRNNLIGKGALATQGLPLQLQLKARLW